MPKILKTNKIFIHGKLFKFPSDLLRYFKDFLKGLKDTTPPPKQSLQHDS